MYLTLILLPFISSIIAGFSGRYLGPLGAAILTRNCLLITVILSFFMYYEVIIIGRHSYSCITISFDGGMSYSFWLFQFDRIAANVCCVVTSVSSLILLYTTKYMYRDPHLPRFMFFLSLFTFYIIIIATAATFNQFFVGCGGVGFCSYFLINFWLTRIGDFGIFLIDLGGDILCCAIFIWFLW